MVKRYNEFINELHKVLSNQSGSGRTKEFDLIWDTPEDAKNLASGVLLKNDLKNKEFISLITSFKDFSEPENKMAKKTKEDKLKITINNLRFLKEKESELGELNCEYCGAGPLKVYDIEIDGGRIIRSYFNPKDGATCDHKQPISKGGDWFNFDNLAVCCYDCNNKKEDRSYDDWMHFIDKRKTMSYKKWVDYLKTNKSS